MPRTVEWYTLNGCRTRIIWGSKLARLLGWKHRNFGVTLNAHTIRFKEHWATRRHLAHESGHLLQAERRGWLYLPWVLWGYLTTFSHDNSPAEQGADLYMNLTWRNYPNLGVIPADVSPDPR